MKAKGPAQAGTAAFASLSDEEELEDAVAFDGGTWNLEEPLKELSQALLRPPPMRPICGPTLGVGAISGRRMALFGTLDEGKEGTWMSHMKVWYFLITARRMWAERGVHLEVLIKGN